MWRENLAKPGVADAVLGVIPTRRLTDAGGGRRRRRVPASDASQAITGETLSADGGMHATVNL